MLKSLKKRPRSDNLKNQNRRPGSAIGKYIYLVILGIFGLGLANYLWGDVLILHGDGLVIRDQTVVAATFVARVSDVDVAEGQYVREGDTLFRIESTEVLERLADLSIRQAELTQQAAELQLRSEVTSRLLPLAVQRAMETGKVLSRYAGFANSGLTTSDRYEEVLRANYDASQDRVRLEAENRTLERQMSAVTLAHSDATMAVENLKTHYSDGTIRAGTTGSVGAQIPSVGDVYRAGEPILTIFSGQAYVLTYLPSRYLFPITTGMEVTVSSGRHRSTGVIDEILPLSDALPQEFQNTFKPRERSQLAKIRLNDPGQFPMFEKVTIERKYF